MNDLKPMTHWYPKEILSNIENSYNEGDCKTSEYNSHIKSPNNNNTLSLVVTLENSLFMTGIVSADASLKIFSPFRGEILPIG